MKTTPRRRSPDSMEPELSAGVMRTVLAILGTIATGTGLLVALRGTASIPGGAPTVASNDSALRFYAVWWAAQGPAAWRLARDPDLNERRLRAVCATMFLGGFARLAAMRTSGRPHRLFEALTVSELLLPPVLIAVRRRMAARRR